MGRHRRGRDGPKAIIKIKLHHIVSVLGNLEWPNIVIMSIDIDPPLSCALSQCSHHPESVA